MVVLLFMMRAHGRHTAWLECDYLDSTRSIIEVHISQNPAATRCKKLKQAMRFSFRAFLSSSSWSIEQRIMVSHARTNSSQTVQIMFSHDLEQGMLASGDAAGLKKLLGERLAFGTAGCRHTYML